MIAVAELHLHPIKACGRVTVERAEIGRFGLVGDREWQVQRMDGSPVTQRQAPVLATVRPALDGDALVLRAPGRSDVEVARPGSGAVRTTALDLQDNRFDVVDAGDEAARWFCALLDEEVRLVATSPTHDRPVIAPFHPRWTETNLSDLAPVLLANTASLDELVARASEPFGIERFRANVVVDGAPPWDEDTWSVVRIGAATASGCTGWPRCAVPQVDQETGERHRDPAKVLASMRRCVDGRAAPPGVAAGFEGSTLFGVGAALGPVGATIAVGDPVEVIERGPAFGVNGGT